MLRLLRYSVANTSDSTCDPRMLASFIVVFKHVYRHVEVKFTFCANKSPASRLTHIKTVVVAPLSAFSMAEIIDVTFAQRATPPGWFLCNGA
jgi:hypothetical protein